MMSNEKINVKQLKIMVETNNDKDAFPLTYSKIYNPVASRVPANVEMSEYPYFTGDVPYPETILGKKEYSELLRVFFDKNEFVDVIVKPYRSQTGGAPKTHDVNQINKNIMTMLFLLFPTNYPTYGNIESSYDKYLLKKSSEFKFSMDQISNAFSTDDKINEDARREYSYLKLPSGVCTVSEVVWLNDVLNEPVYRALVDKLIEYNEWVEDRKITLNADIEKSVNLLTNGLKNTPTLPSSDYDKQKIEKEIESSFRITEEELVYLKKQMQIFTKENMQTEMKVIFDTFFAVAPGKENEYQKYKTILFDNFSKKINHITQEREFKQEFDFSIFDSHKKKDETIEYVDFFQLHQAYSGEMENIRMIDELNNKNNVFTMEKDALIDEQKSITEKKGDRLEDMNTQILLNVREMVTQIQSNIPNPNTFTFDAKNKIEELKTQLANNIQAITSDTTFTNTIMKMIKKMSGKPTATKVFADFKEKTTKLIQDITTQINHNIAQMKEIDSKIKSLNESMEKNQQQIATLSKSNPLFRMNIITVKADNSDASFKKNTEAIIDEMNSNTSTIVESNTDSLTFPQSLKQIRMVLKDNIERLQHLLYKSFEKYVKSLPFTRSDRLMFEKKEIDDNIEKMTKNIHTLNELNATDRKPVNEIINLSESIQNFFDKIRKSGQISGLSTIEIKIARIVKLANEIKAFKLIQDNVLSPDSKGLFVYYEKEFAGNEQTKRLFLDELRKEKYSVFVNTVAYIQKIFLQNNHQSMNQELQTKLNQYFQNKSNDLYTELIHPADELINEGIQPVFSNLWNTSVTSKKTSAESKDPEYEIFVYMEVIQGELNPTNKGMVKCDYLDEKLTILFDRLMSARNQFELIRTKPFSIEETIEKQKKQEADSIQAIADAKSKIESAKEQLPQATQVLNPLENPMQLPMADAIRVGGKKRSTRRKYKRNNYYYTVRKY